MESSSKYRILLILILGVGLLVRVVAIDRVPPALWSDEANHGLEANDIVKTGRIPLFFPGNCGQEPLFKYAVAMATWLIGPGVDAIRMPSACVGWILLPLTFIWFRRRTGNTQALWMLFFLSVGVWHLHYSRIGFRAILGPTLGMLSLLSVDWFRSRPGSMRAGITGVAAGLLWYTYPAFRLFPVITAIWFLYSLNGGSRKISVITAFASGFIVSLLPMLWSWKTYPELFTARASMAAIWRETPDLFMGIVRNTLRHLGMFVIAGDRTWRHNLSGAPQLDPVTSVFFLIGLGKMISRRNPVDRIMFLWVAVMLIPGILSVERQAPHGLRTLGVLPVPYFIAAEGVMWVYAIMQSRRKLIIGSCVIALLTVGLNGYRFFMAWPTGLSRLSDTDESLFGYNRQEFALGLWLSDQDSTERIYLSPQLYLHPTTAYIAGNCSYPMLVHPGELAIGDRVVLQPVERNLWWLRDDFRKNFFLWWREHGLVSEADIWEAMARFYPDCERGGLASSSDRVIMDRLEIQYRLYFEKRVGGLPVFRIDDRNAVESGYDTFDLSQWIRVPDGCFSVILDSIPGTGIRLTAREEDSERTWLLDDLRSADTDESVMSGCLLFPSCIRLEQDSEKPFPYTFPVIMKYDQPADPEPYFRQTFWGVIRSSWAQFRMSLGV